MEEEEVKTVVIMLSRWETCCARQAKEVEQDTKYQKRKEGAGATRLLLLLLLSRLQKIDEEPSIISTAVGGVERLDVARR